MNKEQKKSKSASNWLIPAIVALCVVGVIGWVNYQNGHPELQTSAPAAESQSSAGQPTASMAPEITGDTVPSYFASAEAAKPYPKTLPPEQFQIPVIVHAYAVAKAMPGVLAQEPCYCYCSKTAGHRGLLDCYADLHGSSCSVCVAEALFTEKMTKEGRTPAEIREAIIRGDWRSIELN
jgi:hypothetical protein